MTVLKSLTLRTAQMLRQVRSTEKKPSKRNLLATLERIPPTSIVENAPSSCGWKANRSTLRASRKLRPVYSTAVPIVETGKFFFVSHEYEGPRHDRPQVLCLVDVLDRRQIEFLTLTPRRQGRLQFPPFSTAVSGAEGDPLRVLADVLYRRLVDANPTDPIPLNATQPCPGELLNWLL